MGVCASPHGVEMASQEEGWKMKPKEGRYAPMTGWAVAVKKMVTMRIDVEGWAAA